MSSTRFPELVDVHKFSDQLVDLEGVVAFGEMPRLVDVIRSSEGEASVRLHFCKDDHRRILISGSVDAELVLECQRCLGEMKHRVRQEILVCVVRTDEQARNLPRTYDPFIIEEGNELSLISLIEEELLLGVPSYAIHEASDCPASTESLFRDEPEDADTKTNPFSVLAELKLKK